MLRRLIDSPWLYFSLAGALLVVAIFSLIEINLPKRPVGGLADLDTLSERDDLNVVFILVDTLRADHVGSYGYERDTTPTIDFLAGTGVRFAHVQSQSSWTKASMASLWTGFYPGRTGVTRYDDGIPEEATLPAEILKAAGLRTGGIFRNGWVAPNFGFAQGFDVYFHPKIPTQTPERFERPNPSSHPLQGTDFDVTESALEFLRSYGHERFFLYLHFMDVHQYLYDVDSALFGNSIADVYDNALHWTDRNVSVLMRALDDKDLLDHTLVVIAADHGESFYEHGEEGHARTLYREVTETPLIFVLPFRLEPGVVIESPVQNVDIWPTVLDLLGLEGPAADGRSLLPLLRGALGEEGEDVAAFEGRASFSELDRFWGKTEEHSRPMVALVRDGYRMIRFPNGEQEDELYDHASDPTEQVNLAAKRPELVAELGAEIDGFITREPAFDSIEVELDEMRINQLRALGYIIK